MTTIQTEKIRALNKSLRPSCNCRDAFIFMVRIFVTRLAEIPECWSLEFQLDATFGDNFGHICRQIMYICRQFYHMAKTI